MKSVSAGDTIMNNTLPAGEGGNAPKPESSAAGLLFPGPETGRDMPGTGNKVNSKQYASKTVSQSQGKQKYIMEGVYHGVLF